ncbi:MAG: SCO family protein [Mariprofundaceae bacterium]|nr:SCO family protein [Mariprofundaceae bacterium]
MKRIGIGISGLVWLMLATTGAWAQTAAEAEMHAAIQQRMSDIKEQHTGTGTKSYGDDYDSDAALKISQAAIGRKLDGYQFLDRQGQTVSLADYRGKPLMISMIYTSCFHICPTTTQNLARAVATARSAVDEDAFRVLTIGFDARNDTPDRMRIYARQQGVSREKNWAFLTADQATIDRLTTDLGFLYAPSSKGFDHLVQTTLVDGEGKIYQQVYGMEVDPAILTQATKALVFGLDPVSFNLSSLVNRVRLFCTVYDPASDSYKFNYAMIFGMVIGVLVVTATGITLIRLFRQG